MKQLPKCIYYADAKVSLEFTKLKPLRAHNGLQIYIIICANNKS